MNPNLIIDMVVWILAWNTTNMRSDSTASTPTMRADQCLQDFRQRYAAKEGGK